MDHFLKRMYIKGISKIICFQNTFPTRLNGETMFSCLAEALKSVKVKVFDTTGFELVPGSFFRVSKVVAKIWPPTLSRSIVEK